ncbi:hypothetical protein Tco_0775060 [Tanacetum coccineum]
MQILWWGRSRLRMMVIPNYSLISEMIRYRWKRWGNGFAFLVGNSFSGIRISGLNSSVGGISEIESNSCGKLIWGIILYGNNNLIIENDLKDAKRPGRGPYGGDVEREGMSSKADASLYTSGDEETRMKTEAATTASGLDAEQDRGNKNKTQYKETPNELSSLGTSSGGGPKRQETMGDTIAQTRSENVSKSSNDPLLARGNILQSGEDRLKLQELMELCTKFQNRVIDLDNTKVARSARIVSSDEASLSDQEDASKQERKIDDIDKDAEITLNKESLKSAKVHEKANVIEEPSESITTTSTLTTKTAATTIIASSTRPKAKGLVIHEQEQAPTLIVSSQQPLQAKIQDKGKAKMIEPEPVKKLSKKDQLKLIEEGL